MTDLSYVYAKSADAVQCLTTGKGRIKERLVEACQDGFVMIDREALPGGLKPLYDEILSLVQGETQSTRGAFRSAIENLSEDDAQRAATLMNELKCRLRAVAG